MLDHGHQSPFTGRSTGWSSRVPSLKKNRGAIDRLREERHRVAHEVLGLIVDPNFDLDVQALYGAADVLNRIGSFFGRLNLDANPEFDGVEIDPDTTEQARRSSMRMSWTPWRASSPVD